MILIESGASAILHFSSRDCAETAKSTMHGKRFNGRLLRVEWSNPSKKSSDINSRGGTPTFKKPIGIQEGVIDDLSLTERTLSYNSIHVQFESEPVRPACCIMSVVKVAVIIYCCYIFKRSGRPCF